MKHTRNIGAVACLILGLLFAQEHRALGQGHDDNSRDSHRTVVLNASVNFSTNQMTVVGAHFPSKPHLVLNDQELTIVSSTDTTIVATLPAAVLATPGSYGFTLEQPRRSVLAPFIVTIGAVGPQGPIGLTGPQGSPGIQGMPGPQGQQGLQGLQGPAGSSLPPTVYGATFVGGVSVGTLPTGIHTTLAQLTLPAGSYFVHALVNGPVGVSDTLSCDLIAASQGAQSKTASSVVTIANGQVSLTEATNIPMIAAYASVAGSTTSILELVCATANSVESGITATLVAEPVTVGSSQQFTNSIGNSGSNPIATGGWNRVGNVSSSAGTSIP